jgi:arsenate reductase
MLQAPGKVTIYHNPKCGTSRNTLEMIKRSGIEPEIILYLENPPSREMIQSLVQKMQIPIRDILRRKGTPFDELGLDNPLLNEDQILDAIEKHPILMNRPIVVTSKGIKLCRPSEVVLEILENPNIGEFVKEDGEKVNSKI